MIIIVFQHRTTICMKYIMKSIYTVVYNNNEIFKSLYLPNPSISRIFFRFVGLTKLLYYIYPVKVGLKYFGNEV